MHVLYGAFDLHADLLVADLLVGLRDGACDVRIRGDVLAMLTVRFADEIQIEFIIDRKIDDAVGNPISIDGGQGHEVLRLEIGEERFFVFHYCNDSTNGRMQ